MTTEIEHAVKRAHTEQARTDKAVDRVMDRVIVLRGAIDTALAMLRAGDPGNAYDTLQAAVRDGEAAT